MDSYETDSFEGSLGEHAQTAWEETPEREHVRIAVKHQRRSALQSSSGRTEREVPKAQGARSRAKVARHSAPGRAKSDPTLIVGILGIAALVAVLAPLLAISAYNHSYADDWHYGVWAHLALAETSNPIQAFFVVIWTALQQAGIAWFDWQGTYSAIFIMALEPSVFGEGFYVLAAPIVLTTLIAGTFFFSHVMLCELMDCPRGAWIGISSLLICIQLLLQPSPVEGIFWFNSAVYYTTYNAAGLALFGCVGRLYLRESERHEKEVREHGELGEDMPNEVSGRRAWGKRALQGAHATKGSGFVKPTRKLMIGYCLLAVFIAGGNYVTALVVAEIMTVVMVVLWRKNNRCMVNIFIGYALLMLGLVISFVAPGNSVRQATQFPEDSAGVIGTIVGSSIAAFQYLQEWSSSFVLILIAASVPIALFATNHAAKRGFTFPYPLWVAAGSIALFATSFTPTYWAEGGVGPGRVQNCRFDIFLVLVVVNVFWFCGWLEAKRLKASEHFQTPEADEWFQPAQTGEHTFTKHATPLLTPKHICQSFGIIMLVFVCVCAMFASDAGGTDNNLSEKLSSVSAAKSLVSGKAAEYHEQVLERLETIETSTESTLEVPFYHDIPHVLWMGDIRDNMDNYINYRLCQWYGKESIIGYSEAKAKAASVDGVSETKSSSSSTSSESSAS